MLVEIDLPEKDARWFRSMASLGRLCDSVIRVLATAYDAVEDATLKSQLLEAEQDMEALKPHICNLHYNLRIKLVGANVKALWDQNQG